jgi:hypothetical protein
MTSISKLIRIASQYRAYVRQQCKAREYVRIDVVDGARAPEMTGEAGHYTTPGGKPVYHPNAYRKAWGKPVYHCSTISVEVGRGWLAARRIPEWAMYPTRDAEELIRLGVCGPAGQAGLVFEMAPERIVDEIGVRMSSVEARA